MTISSTILTLISTFLGGGLGAFLTYKLGSRKQDNNDFAALVGEYKALVGEYKEEVEMLRVEVAVFRNDLAEKDKEIINLRNQLMIFESSHTDIPLPMWLKDTSGIMLFINDEYERLILLPLGKKARDYIGQTDVEFWGKDIGLPLTQNDQKVMRNKRPEKLTEEWTGVNDVLHEGRIVKYPRFSGKTVVGIGGVVTEHWVKK